MRNRELFWIKRPNEGLLCCDKLCMQQAICIRKCNLYSLQIPLKKSHDLAFR